MEWDGMGWDGIERRGLEGKESVIEREVGRIDQY